MDRNDTDNIINISSEERDSRAGRGNKKIAAVFCLMALACLGGLVYITVRINDQKNKLESEVKSSKEALTKANEVISKYELATGTKAVENVENAKVTEIVKPMAMDTRIGDLMNFIKARAHKMTGKNDEGFEIKDSWPIVDLTRLYTNKDATYLFAVASEHMNYEVITNPTTGATRVEGAGGGHLAMYYRALPNGEWKFATAGQAPDLCENLSPEVKYVYRGVKDPNGNPAMTCRDEKIKENNGFVDL